MIKRLMVLGSLGEFVKLIDMARARGIYTIVCDGYHKSPGKSRADKSYDIDVGDTDAIAVLCKREHVEAITTSFSDYLFECMVKIAHKADLPCYVMPADLPFYRDKYQMKETLCELGVASPRFAVLSSDFSDGELAGIRFPVVVKPLDKYGSRGLKVLHSIGDIRSNFARTCETSGIKKILAEEYNDGYEFNMMTWILDGCVQVISIADREKSSAGANEIPISSRNVYPSRLMPHVLNEAKSILQKFATRMNQTAGPLSMQFFWGPDRGIQVCEIAGRFFGYEHELVEYSGGLSIEELLLAYACGDTEGIRALFANHNPFFETHTATLYFHGREGMTIQHQDKARALAREEQVLESCLFYEEGSTVTHFGMEPYVARFYISAGTRKELDEKTDRIFRHMTITDAAGREVLYKNRIEDYHDL